MQSQKAVPKSVCAELEQFSSSTDLGFSCRLGSNAGNKRMGLSRMTESDTFTMLVQAIKIFEISLRHLIVCYQFKR